jgi:hypothetical protein
VYLVFFYLNVFAIPKIICTFAMRNFFTKYALGIFYTHLANVNNILVRTSVFYFAAEQVKEFRRLGSFSPFLFIK